MKQPNEYNLPRNEYDDPNIVYLYLSLGKREPQDDHEKKVLKQIREMEAKGGTVEIPFN